MPSSLVRPMLLFVGLLAHQFVCVGALAEGAPGEKDEVLGRALANRYDLDLAQRVELVVRNKRGAQRRYVVEMASKRVKGQLRSFARFLEPESDSGTAILMLEQAGRYDDTFVYFPYAKRVRRVSSAQRSDRFMGTDLTFEDFERRYPGDYEILSSSEKRVRDERVSIIRVKPTFDAPYAEAEFDVAEVDDAILSIRYFKAGDEHPYRILEAPRSHMTALHGHVLPKMIEITSVSSGTTTEVRVRDLEVDPELEDSLFTEVSLQVRRPILPGYNQSRRR